MRFFRMQDQARRRSRRLVGWYCLAFAGTVASVSAVLGTLIGWLSPHEQLWWHYALPGALFTAMTVGLSLHRLRQIDDDGSAVAKALGGERLQLQQAHFLERRLLNLVAETAVAAGLPPPQVYLLRRDHSINAFAAGRSPECAVIGVTYGALVQLKRDELQAVVAHEFSHILNRDTRLNQRLSGWLYGLQGISSSGRYLLYGRDDTADDYRRRKNVDNHPFDNAVEIFFQSLPWYIPGGLLLVLGAAGSLFASWVQAAVSRQREFLADAAAVQFTRQTEPLVEALRKTALAGGHRLHSPHAPEYAHMLFAGLSYARLAATHPPLLERIRRLDPVAARRLASELAEHDAVVFAHTPFHRLAPPGQPLPEHALAAEQKETEYRRCEAMMQSRIRRHRVLPGLKMLPADWQAAAYDGERATAALLYLFQAHRLPEKLLLAAGTPLFVRQQLRQLAKATLMPDAELLEHVLPAFVMQPPAAQQAALDLIRIALRRQVPTADTAYLWLLLKAYLAPLPQPGRLAEHPVAAGLIKAEQLSVPELQTALKAALLLNEPGKNALLQPLAQRLPATHPLLWRLLCVRLDMASWHFGV